MYRKQILIVLVALSAAWLGGTDRAVGQTTTRKATNPTLGERLDNFGHKIVDGSLFDGVFSRNKSKQPATRRQPSRQQETWPDEEDAPRAGSTLGAAKSPGRSAGATSPPRKPELFSLGLDGFHPGSRPSPAGSTGAQSGPRGASPEPTVPGYRDYANDFPTQSEAVQTVPIRRPLMGAAPSPGAPAHMSQPAAGITPETVGPPSSARVVSSTPTMGGLVVHNTTLSDGPPAATAPVAKTATSDAQPNGSDVPSTPLHERLARFRQSVFGAGADPSATATRGPASPAAAPVATTPAASGAAVAGQPTLAPVRKSKDDMPTQTPSQAATAPTEEARPASPSPVDGPSLTKQVPTLAPRQPDEQPGEAAAGALAGGAAQPAASAPATPAEEVRVAARAKKPSQEHEQVLLARRSPVLNVRTLGPARIAVGKQATYEVLVENQGDVAADDVVVTMSLPDWADVAGREATSGAILPEPAPGGGMQLLWKIGPMEAKVRQKATLAIVPRQSRPIDLAVRWDFTPVTSQTVIEVEEPRLAMRLGGPREVRFGEPQVFKLEIANSGNGAAGDVVLTLMPLVPGEGGPTQHRLGALAAGEQKVIDMELTARQPGSLAVQMELRCDGPATASLNETLLVRKANVEVAIDAPKMQFTGTVATYRVRVRNSGNLTAENVRLVAKIPPEAKLVAADGHGKATADGQSVEWKLEPIAEGAEQQLTLQCQLAREGYTQLKADVVGDKVAAEATAVTRVESVADLAMAVRDPSGPVPVGQKADYTITIHNRGTKDASGVEAIVYFSQGVEPVSAEGSHYTIRPGQVVFDAIGLVPAGKKVTMKIVAQAQTPGSHMFRAEVYCRPLGTKLVSEETTRFYQGELDMPGAGPVERPMLGTNAPPQERETAPQTADRRNEPAGPTRAPAEAPTTEPTAPSEAGTMRY